MFSLFLSVFSVFPSCAEYDPVIAGKQLEFPRDRGAHPGHRIEWWYVTGHLKTKSSEDLGFQVTFFRVRNPDAETNPSRFSPKQLLFAHAALADPAAGRLLHAQRSARMIEGLVEAREGETQLRLDGWSLVREGSIYRTRITDGDFSLELDLAPTQQPMLQGDRGFSRKAPAAAHASYYYSEPQLRVKGRITRKAGASDVEGVAWLDHEWSSALLAPEAAGWDWLGANLEDGSALMAFRMRSKDGATVWAAGSIRSPGGA
ncbi:MAG: carotenoid 1,2-hydratase, partial [Usitatibacter sp.]